MDLSDLTRYLDAYLRIHEIPDYPGALNGLQVDGPGPVQRIAAAVDASEAAIRAAAEHDCDLLLVHHGLFWDGNRAVTGRRFRRLSLLLKEGIAVYSAHLPLDVHPVVGNNAVLARALDLHIDGGFGSHDGEEIGVSGTTDVGREALTERLRALLEAPVRLIAGGPDRVRRAGVLTGGGSGFIEDALRAGLDTLITGEAPHHAYFDAVEGGINLLLGGHYATETWGVRALAAHLEERFGLPWVFLRLPTGL